MDDLKAAVLPTVYCTDPPLVHSPDIHFICEQHDVPHLKQFYWKWSVLVGCQRFEGAREEARAAHLKLCSGRVADADSLPTVVRLAHVVKVLSSGDEDPGQHLCETCGSDLRPHEIAQLVERQLLALRDGGGDALGDVVEAVGDGHVLHDVACMENITAGRRHLHSHGLAAVHYAALKLHLAEHLSNWLGLQLHADALVDVLDRHLH
mmetsp:Transcript_24158/g.67184  ORF Transcript_24158/g.67184 Transcript_24158/m.67184 type:complete len:207 (+) Transcript_24158:396-1016(+)